MTEPKLFMPQYVFDDWLAALQTREPRALELAYALSLSLPENAETTALRASARIVRTIQTADGALLDAPKIEIAPEVLVLLQDALAKYSSLSSGNFLPVEMGNPNILAFERTGDGERLLIVNNLARVSQPIKFNAYGGKEGWDILNRVEFTFPARAQLEAYEFLWLLVE